MVRLKVPVPHFVFQQRVVSIPNGSIKSFIVKHDGKYFVMFQFQMVRLKGSKAKEIINSYKSFQFQMVRLKALF